MARRWATSRTEAFSDGVFAIAITLLVLDLRVPSEEFHDLPAGILHQWPAYLGYATSFITIGGIWLSHHGIFARLRYVNAQVMRLNLALLLTVSFLPYPTRLMAEAIRDADAERTAVIFYGLALSAVSLTIGALWAAVLRDRELLARDVSGQEINAATRIAAPNVGLHLGVTALAIFAPRAAAFCYLVVALISVFRARGDDGRLAVDERG
jgi:uncharacterized membrane protein